MSTPESAAWTPAATSISNENRNIHQLRVTGGAQRLYTQALTRPGGAYERAADYDCITGGFVHSRLFVRRIERPAAGTAAEDRVRSADSTAGPRARRAADGGSERREHA